MAIDKKIKYEMQGGVRNYLGKQKEIKAPLKWQSSPNHPSTELAYITQAEKNLLVKQDLHGSLNGKPNKGPSGIMSLNGGGFGSEDKGTNDDGSANSGGDTSVRGPAELGLTTRGPPAAPKDGGGFLDGLKNITTTVKDYVTSGGTIGMAVRGIAGLIDKVTGPKAADYNDGYNMANIAGPRSFDFGPGPGQGKNKIKTPVGIMAVKEITPIGKEPETTTKANNMNFNFGTFSNPIYGKDLV
jgi:hypothetical protein